MTLQIILMLFAAGVAGGIITSMVGGAAMITYPALIASGLAPLPATICNLAAAVPGAFFAALSDRKQLPPFNRAFLGMVAACMIGAAIGALILLATPERLFESLVPVLLGFATVLFAFAQQIGDWARSRALARGRAIDFSVTSLKMLLPISLYGGYFGAGGGVLVLGVMAVATHGDYRSANVVKNLIISLNCGAAALVFIFKGSVIWPQTLTLAAGTIVGGLTGAWLARLIPRAVMRVAVVVVGVLLTVYFAWSYWF